MCLAKRARVDSPPPAATPVLLDPKGKSSVDLYLHPNANEEDHRQEDVLEVDAWAQRRLIAHVGMNQAVGVNDTQEITTTLLNREPPQKAKRQKIIIRKILKQKPDIM
ncbi:hypothetical protein GOP47_0029253 [Adiantum capillus-veneris]|nr:hypothetical protein GOP47_0029253 [Adiantum capillus-veneris]